MLPAREVKRKGVNRRIAFSLSLVAQSSLLLFLFLFLLLLYSTLHHPQNTKKTPRSILYQRGVYPPESFHQKKKYGLSLTVTSDDKLASYLATVLEHLERWLAAGALQRLVLVIAGSPEGDVLERWTFDVQTDARVVAGEG